MNMTTLVEWSGSIDLISFPETHTGDTQIKKKHRNYLINDLIKNNLFFF